MIGIIGAMQIEVDALKHHMNNLHEMEIMNTKFTLGELNGKEIVLALSGVGKVCASMTTMLLLQNFEIDNIINIGTAGALRRDQEILDVVIANHVIQHDYDTSILDGEEGYGIVSTCDKRLIELCEKAFNDGAHKVWVGDIASGDQFISEPEQLEKIVDKFPTCIACEMEAAAIGYVANAADVPIIIIRSLSDNPYRPNSEFDFEAYAISASKRSAMLCSSIVEKL